MSKRLPGTLAAQCAFAALVLATFAAFFVTTKLKRATPVVEQLTFRRHFSPNRDGRLDSETVSFSLRRSDDVTVAVVRPGGDIVATLADDVRLAKGRHRFRWNGRADNGAITRDGEYRVLVRLRHQGRALTSPRKLFVDTTPPQPVVRFVSPDAITPDGTGGPGRARVRFVGPTRKAPTLLVYRTDLSDPRLVARRVGRKDSPNLSWDGRAGLGRFTRHASAGNYLMVVRTRDAAGNDGPVKAPPRRDQVRGHPGLIVRYLAAIGPTQPVRARRIAKFRVLAEGRRYRWSVRRLGSRRSLKHGASGAATLRLRAPRTRKSGLYLLDLRMGARRYSVPFAIQAPRPSRVLVILPVATWLARNPVDSNGDGYADLLSFDARVAVARPFASSGLPRGLQSEVDPMLTFLDRNGYRYDIATDLAPAVARGPGTNALDRYRGVLYAGTPRYVPVALADALRSFVRQQRGTVGWVGVGGLTARTKLVEGELVRVPSSQGTNIFGERVRIDPAGGSLSTVQADGSRLFDGAAVPFGPFPGLELQLAPAPGSKTLASAAPEGGGPAMIAAAYDKGLVVRLGAAGFARSLDPRSGITSSAQIMRNLWNLLRS